MITKYKNVEKSTNM